MKVIGTYEPQHSLSRRTFILFQLKLLKGDKGLSRHVLTVSEARFLQEVLGSDYEVSNIRLREGEYQYSLAKAISTFHSELRFPDVKNIVKRLYGEEKARDVQFIRKIQTILKKMERNNVVKILPKERPWELQRYALSSLKFRDADKNLVTFATDEQIEQMKKRLSLILNRKATPKSRLGNIKPKVYVLIPSVITSYAVTLWALTQPIINPIAFAAAFTIAVTCSLMLGKTISQE